MVSSSATPCEGTHARDAQAVAADSLLAVAVDVVQASNDKQQIEPMLEQIDALSAALGEVQTLLADTGYFSAANVSREAPMPSQNSTPVQAMTHRLSRPEGRKLYALGKQIPEPVFGIIKSVMGFRQFMHRGIDQVRGERNLVTMAWNISGCSSWRRRAEASAPFDTADGRGGSIGAAILVSHWIETGGQGESILQKRDFSPRKQNHPQAHSDGLLEGASRFKAARNEPS